MEHKLPATIKRGTNVHGKQSCLLVLLSLEPSVTESFKLSKANTRPPFLEHENLRSDLVRTDLYWYL